LPFSLDHSDLSFLIITHHLEQDYAKQNNFVLLHARNTSYHHPELDGILEYAFDVQHERERVNAMKNQLWNENKNMIDKYTRQPQSED
jgi:hypothetical protein